MTDQLKLKIILERHLGVSLYYFHRRGIIWMARILKTGKLHPIPSLLQLGPRTVQELVAPGGLPTAFDPR